MRRADLERLARGALEGLPADLQEAALRRATGAPVIVWSHATRRTLGRIYASARTVAMIAEVTP